MDVEIIIKKVNETWTCDDTDVHLKDEPTVVWECTDDTLDWEIVFVDKPDHPHPLKLKKLSKKEKKSKLKKDAKKGPHKYTVRVGDLDELDPELIVKP